MNATADDLPQLAKRAQASLRARLVFANMAGAISVLVFLSLSSGPRLAPDAPFWLSGLVSAATLVVLVVLGYVAGHAAYRRSVRWAFEGRPPTVEERRAMLRQPWRQASRPLGLWLIAAGLYGMFAALAGADLLTLSRLVWTIVLGGVLVCALAHLLVERSFRPLFAVVFRADPPPRPRTLGVRMRVLLTWVVGSAVPLAGIALDATVGDIPGDVDVAIVAVPAEAVQDVVLDCAAKGVHGLIVISSGLSGAESGSSVRE